MDEIEIRRKIWLATLTVIKLRNPLVDKIKIVEFLNDVDLAYEQLIQDKCKLHLAVLTKEENQICLNISSKKRKIWDYIKDIANYKHRMCKELGIYQESFKTFNNIIKHIKMLKTDLWKSKQKVKQLQKQIRGNN